MSTAQRTHLRDAATLGLAMIAIGASFGAIAIASGLPWWAAPAMSTLIFAGGAQFMAVGLLAAGNPLAAILAGLLLNARHLPFGLAVAGAIGPKWRQKLVGSHLMTDEAVAFSLAERHPRRRHRTFWLIAVMLFCTWNVGTVLGVWLGSSVGDPGTFGLDAAFPAGLIALIMPSLRDRDTRLAALTGAVIAVVLTPVLPAGLPVMFALAGVAVLVLPRRTPTDLRPTDLRPTDLRPTDLTPTDSTPAVSGPATDAGSPEAGSAADAGRAERGHFRERPCEDGL